MKQCEPRTLVCIPTYNERDNIERIIPAVFRHLPGCNVLIIDDNSTDGTGRVADGIAEIDTRVNVLHRAQKKGLGKAYRAGFQWGLDRKYDYLIQFDADFSHPPDVLPSLLDKLNAVDLVIGSRNITGGSVSGWGPARRLLSTWGNIYARRVLRMPIQDMTGGFNAIRTDALRRINFQKMVSLGHLFQIELKYRCHKQGLRILEIPIVFSDRTQGYSKLSAAVMAEALCSIWKLRLQ